MTTWRGPGGITVEIITLNQATLYRVSQWINNRRYHIAYAATIHEVARHVDLADLVEVLEFPGSRQDAS
ncbi:hypothetical protein [Nonomuraea sp. NPDC050643]|uniref:hypothetical protein n=1 Tax=Nonomuraea sp. NPDC050643 TaxID=3155660 RepID=UPI0033D52A10